MVFVDIKIASVVTGGREAPKAEGLFIFKGNVRAGSAVVTLDNAEAVEVPSSL